MPSPIDDLRYALRALRRNPVLSLVAVLSMAIGIGANTAIFSLMDRLLFRSLPVRDPQRLVLFRSPGGWSGHIETDYGDEVSFSLPKYRSLAEQSTMLFDGLIARFPIHAGIATRAQTESASAELVSGNYFETLGVAPAIGRLLSDDDARTANPVVVLGYSYWTRRFAGDRAVLNQVITVNGQAVTVVGVVRAGFGSIGAGESPALFVPITLAGRIIPGWEGTEDPHTYWLNIFGRLKPQVSPVQAQAALAVIWQRIITSDANLIGAAGREKYLAKKLALQPAGNGISSVRGNFETPLYLLMGMVGLVLLIACANVANLLLGRAAARVREVAIRVSLGAGRGRLVRQVLAESLVLALAGGALGLIFADWGGGVILRLAPDAIPMAGITADPDGRVLLFTLAVSILTGLLFGCVPAVRATRPDVLPALKDQGTAGSSARHARFRQVLVAGQIAIAALLLASGGLLTHSLRNLNTLNPGFRPGGVTVFSMNPRLIGYTPERARRLVSDLQQQIAEIPGVEGDSVAKWPLLAGAMDASGFRFEGYQGPQGNQAGISDNHVGPGFFGLMGIPLLAGREFSVKDAAGAPPVAIINESCARKFFAGRNPIGLHVANRRMKYVPVEIVGIVKDAKYDDLREEPKAFLYLAVAQDIEPGPVTFYVRNRGAADSLGPSLREVVRRADAGLPIDGLRRMQDQIEDSIFADRMIAALSSAFAGLATVLAAIGLYGVIAWAVSRRKREIGIRMALGARPATVVRMVLSEVLWLGIAGLVVAVPLWLVAGRVLRTVLYGVTERDPLTLVAAILVLASVAGVAGWIPAWRASRIDPNSAIRYE